MVDRWTLVVHGGAGEIGRAQRASKRELAIRAGLNDALQSAGSILARGGSAVDAVEAAVRILEDDPLFNAGKGAVLTSAGTIELDAAIMDGATRRAGAVAGIRRTKNPVSLARAVMDKNSHVMLAGSGADLFSVEMGLEQVDPRYFWTRRRWDQLQRWRRKDAATNRLECEVTYGTVGAVARDIHGHVAAATSTGGLTGKQPGRVGDSPIIGAGTYADDRACAVSATGAGDYYLRAGAAHEICARMRFLDETPQQAADAVQAETKALGGEGGV